MEKVKNETSNETNSSSPNGDGESVYYSYDYDLASSVQAGGFDSSDSANCSIVSVCQRIKVESDEDGVQNCDDGKGKSSRVESSHFTIWALIEYEITVSDTSDGLFATTSKRFLRWRRFHTELSLSDHIRRDSGEPISLPPYSLSPQQSKQMEEEARQAVAYVTEEFRRFRVRAEVARKQTDATVRALQNNNIHSAQKQIEGEDLASELAQARTDHQQLIRLRADMADQEVQWKQAYDQLLTENNSLRSSGSEALLAAQWRQRYETTLSEKDNLESLLEMEREKLEKIEYQRKKEDAGKYESKYKDLKESFRLYRKKAKEIFEARHCGEAAVSLE